jgi:hypothetical protein
MGKRKVTILEPAVEEVARIALFNEIIICEFALQKNLK